MKTQGKQRISGGNKWEHWLEMSQQKHNNCLKFLYLQSGVTKKLVF